MSWPSLKPGEIEYPESDGQPMAETDRHRDLMADLIAATRYHFRDVPDVYVSGNLFVYFVEGDPRECVAPDFFFVRGVPKGQRRIYKVWEEGKAPEVVIELTSTKTHREDLGEKRAIYEELGVQEYFLFDPEGIRFQPPLKGFRLDAGVMQAVEAEKRADGTLVLWSDVLGLELHGRGDTLRLVDRRNGKPLPAFDDFAREVEEERQRADESEAQVKIERERANALAEEVAKLREKLKRSGDTPS